MQRSNLFHFEYFLRSTQHFFTQTIITFTYNIKQLLKFSFNNNILLCGITIIVFTYKDFNNILKLFDVLPNFPFPTSETIRDYYL